MRSWIGRAASSAVQRSVASVALVLDFLVMAGASMGSSLSLAEFSGASALPAGRSITGCEIVEGSFLALTLLVAHC